MPTVIIEGPPIKELDKKRKLAKDITEVAANAYGLPDKAIVVLIKENAPENVSVGGQLITDRRQRNSNK